MRPLAYCFDDDELTLQALSRILEKVGNISVVSFGSAEDLLERVLSQPPDLLIVDQNHPGISGLDLASRIRCSSRGGNVPIWLITGSAMERDSAYSAGVTLLLRKPVRIDELVDHLRNRFPSTVSGPVDIDAEGPDLDLKERPDLSTANGIAALAKDVIAMANSGGGSIVFGKRDHGHGEFEWVGLDEESLRSLEVSNLNKAINAFVDPAIHVSTSIHRKRGVTLVVVSIPAATELVLARRQNDAARLYCGRIYLRTANAESAEARESTQVRQLVNRLVETARKRHD